MALLVVFLGAVALIIASSLIRGFVLSYMWEWFVVPLGVMSLDFVHAIGISMIVSFLTAQGCKSDNEDGISEAIGSVLISPFVVLLIGYIVHSFM